MNGILVKLCVIGVAMLGLAGPVVAASVTLGSTTYYVQTTGLLPGNDCAGALGKPPGCNVLPAVGVDAPLVAKYDWQDKGKPPSWKFEAGSFATVTGGEFVVTGGGKTSGTFSYAPGAADPVVRFWSLKAGPSYAVFWLTLAATGPGASAANAVRLPTGDDCGGPCVVSWSWPFNKKGLSHIAFFGEPSVVPLPAAAWLLLSGLLGLGVLARRRKAPLA